MGEVWPTSHITELCLEITTNSRRVWKSDADCGMLYLLSVFLFTMWNVKFVEIHLVIFYILVHFITLIVTAILKPPVVVSEKKSMWPFKFQNFSPKSVKSAYQQIWVFLPNLCKSSLSIFWSTGPLYRTVSFSRSVLSCDGGILCLCLRCLCILVGRQTQHRLQHQWHADGLHRCELILHC